MQAQWQIKPKRGLGKLVFGLSAEEVAALAPVYGTPSLFMTHHHMVEAIETTIAQLGPALSAEDAAVLRRAAEQQARLGTQVLHGTGPTLLEYDDGRLSGVTVEAKCGPAHFEGQALFTMSARDVLALFEKANGAPGRCRSTETAFDNLAVSLHGFSRRDAHGVRAMPGSDTDFAQRSVTVRAAPYQPADEMDQFVVHSFL
ncbi:hypothetical protein [Phreatobacter sp. AB_2022a]|uniref:hypothetical protein n=1 Tax=Phreatobacter sp. AB_2022a TaxID=3003134 RepID=UPI002286FA54|nr:hypothetical protein [Phreatobacter sp. AB_2022a]MCZ0737889.1 hypothetical protein [Phreatobacter sp. AB_2022a]